MTRLVTPLTIVAAVVLLLAVAAADRATGAAVFTLPYLLPVLLAARAGRAAAVALALAGAGAAAHGQASFAAWPAVSDAAVLLAFALLAPVPGSGAAQGGLVDREGLLLALREERERVRRHRRVFTMACVVLSGKGGDDSRRVLRVAAALAERLRITDVQARLGASDLVLLLPETDAQQLLPFLEALRQRATEAVGDPGIQVRLGAVTFRTAPADAEEALGRIESVLHRVRMSGGGGIAHEVFGS